MRKLALLLVLAVACSNKVSGFDGDDRNNGQSDDDNRTDDDTPGGDDDTGGTTYGWQQLKIGGGGYVVGGDVADDGTKVFKTDTSGGYLYDDASGRFSLVVPTNLPAGTNLPWNGGGVYDILIAPSDSNVIWALYGNVAWRSVDRGASFSARRSGMQFNSNGSIRTNGRHGAIDPKNPNHVLVSDQVAMYQTTDNSATWTTPAGLPPAQAQPPQTDADFKEFSGVAFNPYGNATGDGRTAEAIVSTGGVFYRTVDGGDTWTSIGSGGPNTDPVYALFDQLGRYNVVQNGGLYQYTSAGGWRTLRTNDTWSFYVDPANADHIWVGNVSVMDWAETTNNGTSWAAYDGRPVVQKSVDGIPWHETSARYYPGNYFVDMKNKVAWIPGGNQGVASYPLSRLTSSTENHTLDIHGIGIEQICPVDFVAPTGSKRLHGSVWDEHYMQLDRDNASYPSIVNDVGTFVPSWGIAGSKQNPRFLARWLSSPEVAKSGFSTDDGATWTPFANLPRATGSYNMGTVFGDDQHWGYGGHVAFSGTDNIIIISSMTGNTTGTLRMPYYTLDRGSTWSPVTLPTAWTHANLSGVHNGNYLYRNILVADATRVGRFYFMVPGGGDAAMSGFYSTDDGGVTWTKQHDGMLLQQTYEGYKWLFHAHLESPVTNHLWAGAGSEDQAPNTSGTYGLYRSFDGAKTFEALPDVLTPEQFGFGAPARPGGYPVLFMAGSVRGRVGMWMTANADAAAPDWIFLGDTAGGIYNGIVSIAGDPDVPGRLYVGMGCAGAQMGEFGNLLP